MGFIAVRTLTWVLLAVASTANAQDQRIGYVNVDRIMRASPISDAAMQRLRAEFGDRLTRLDEEQRRLRRAAFLRGAERLPHSREEARLLRELSEREASVARERRAVQAQLERRQSEELRSIADQLVLVTRQVAEQGHYAAILGEAAYVAPENDLTERILDRMRESAGK